MSSKLPRLDAQFGQALLAMSLLGGVAPAGAAPKQIEAFNPQSWAALQAGLKAPAIVVFSSTDCVHCPAVLKNLAGNPQRRAKKIELIAVVMDQAPGSDDAALLTNPHYRVADRLLAFDGQSQVLRYAVDPQWRGMTPYVALLRPGAATQFVMGPPSAADLQAWLPKDKAGKP
jgi:hypothetical protein